MSRPGLKNMLFGLLWFVGAIAVVLATDRLFYVALIIGAVQFIIGLGQFILYSFKSADKKAQFHAGKGLVCLYQSMVSVAMADGELGQDEVELIQSVFHKVTGSEVSQSDIETAATAIGKNLDGFLTGLKDYAGLVDEDIKALTVRACVYVAAADGSISTAEQEHLYRVSKILGFSKPQVDDHLTEVLQPA